jgi:AraC-like DNA-binding protein
MIRVAPIFDSKLVTLERIDHPPGVSHVDPIEEQLANYSINFIERGGFAVSSGATTWTIGASDVFVTVPGMVYRYRHDHGTPDDVCLAVCFKDPVRDDIAALGSRVPVVGLNNRRAMSPFHFARVFRDLTGVPPHRYLVNVRLTAAAAALREGASVTDTCFAVGFRSLSHFIHAFRQAYGVTPSAFARSGRRL